MVTAQMEMQRRRDECGVCESEQDGKKVTPNIAKTRKARQASPQQRAVTLGTSSAGVGYQHQLLHQALSYYPQTLPFDTVHHAPAHGDAHHAHDRGATAATLPATARSTTLFFHPYKAAILRHSSPPFKAVPGS